MQPTRRHFKRSASTAKAPTKSWSLFLTEHGTDIPDYDRTHALNYRGERAEEQNLARQPWKSEALGQEYQHRGEHPGLVLLQPAPVAGIPGGMLSRTRDNTDKLGHVRLPHTDDVSGVEQVVADASDSQRSKQGSSEEPYGDIPARVLGPVARDLVKQTLLQRSQCSKRDVQPGGHLLAEKNEGSEREATVKLLVLETALVETVRTPPRQQTVGFLVQEAQDE
jgi:hypothetical protein